MTESSEAAAIVRTDQRMSAAETHRLDCGNVAIFSERCPGKESANEDGAAVLRVDPSAVVLAVADGMGGGAAGEVASALSLQALAEALAAPGSIAADGSLRPAILNGMELANQRVLDLGVGAATTLAVLEIQNRTARPYHVGDSLILIVSNRGKIKWQNVAHSPVGYGVEAGLLDAFEAMQHEDRHLVSNMVGATDMRIEIGAPIELAQRDSLLVASDGLSDNLHTEEIVERIRKGPLAGAANELARAATQRMFDRDSDLPSKPDDLTFVLYRLPRRPEQGAERRRSDKGGV